MPAHERQEPVAGLHPIPRGDLPEVEADVLEWLVAALRSLQDADKATKLGLVSDHCENAAREIRAAMRLAGG